MIYRFADCELDRDLYELRRAGRGVPLQPQVFEVLAYLVANHTRLVTKPELIGHVWPDRYISDAALNSRVMSARKAIGDSGDSQTLVRTVHGRGYRFVGAVTAVDATWATAHARPNLVQVPKQQIAFCRTSDGVGVAYATAGDGPPLVKAANWLSHLEFDSQSPVWRHWLRDLSAGRTLVRYDERGCGLSDWDVGDFSFENWVADLEAVVDSLNLETFDLLGLSQGGSVAIAYAVRHPERVRRLILHGSFTKGWAKRGSGDEVEERRALLTLTRQGWGRDNPAYRQVFATQFIPDATPEQVRWFGDLCRVSTSPENAVRFMEAFGDIDVEVLASKVACPVLVTHSRRDARIPFEAGRRLVELITNASFVPLESANHILLEDEPAWAQFVSSVREFLGSRPAASKSTARG